MFNRVIFIFSILIWGCNSASSSYSISRQRNISRNSFNQDENIMLDILESYMDRYPEDNSYEGHLSKLIKREIWPNIESTLSVNEHIINAKCKEHGENILHLSYLIGDEYLIQNLFNSGVEFIIDAKDNKGLTPLQKMVEESKNEEIACKLFSSLFKNVREENIYGSDRDGSIESISKSILKRNSTTGRLLKLFLDKAGKDISEKEANKHLLYFAEIENIEMVRYILDNTKAKANMEIFRQNRVYDKKESEGTLLKYLLLSEVTSEKLLPLIFKRGNYGNSEKYSDNLFIAKYILDHSKSNNKLLREMLRAGIGEMKTESKETFIIYTKKNYKNNDKIMRLINNKSN